MNVSSGIEIDIFLTLIERATSNFRCNLLQHLNMLRAYSVLIVNYLFRNVNDSNMSLNPTHK